MTLDEYSSALNNFLGSDDFSPLSPEEGQEAIKQFRAGYLFENPLANVEEVDRITENRNVSYHRNTGKERPIPKINVNFPDQEDGYRKLSKSEKTDKLEEFKLKIPEIAKGYPTQRADTEFYLNQHILELERQNNHQDFLIVWFVVYVVVLAGFTTSFWLEVRSSVTAQMKKKRLDRNTIILAALFGLTTSALLYFMDKHVFIPIPLIAATAGAFIVMRHKKYCESCKAAVWTSECSHCRAKQSAAL